MWLQDVLPSRVPHARVMSFKYDSREQITSAPAIRQKAIELLEDLEEKRSRDEVIPASCAYSQASQAKYIKDRHPIVFLCYNFGGVIVKQVL